MSVSVEQKLSLPELLFFFENFQDYKPAVVFYSNKIPFRVRTLMKFYVFGKLRQIFHSNSGNSSLLLGYFKSQAYETRVDSSNFWECRNSP